MKKRAKKSSSSTGGVYSGSNLTLYVNGAVVSGMNCTVYGNGNTVSGMNATVIGDDNVVSGMNASVRGNRNRVSGMHAKVRGDDNVLSGMGARVTGGERNRIEEEPSPAGGMSFTSQGFRFNLCGGVIRSVGENAVLHVGSDDDQGVADVVQHIGRDGSTTIVTNADGIVSTIRAGLGSQIITGTSGGGGMIFNNFSGGKKREREEPVDEVQYVEGPPEAELEHDKEDDGSKEGSGCVICLTNASICIVWPCRHACLCVKVRASTLFPPRQRRSY